MLGFKSSVPKVLKYLKDKGIYEIASTEFCQGRVTRWGLAWSHSVKLTCESFPEESASTKQKPKPPLRWTIPNAERKSTFVALLDRMKLLMDQLNVSFQLSHIFWGCFELLLILLSFICSSWDFFVFCLFKILVRL